MKKKRVFKLAAIVLGVIACLIGGYAYWDGLQSRVNVAAIEDKTSSEVSAEIEQNFTRETSKLTLSKYENYSEGQLIQEVHKMSHQKVFAHQKWGSSEITREKVVKLLEVIQGTTFEQESTKKMLLSVLEPWATGDFSDAVAGHNSIWNHQGGTVGEAIRLLTPKEELIYIEENFR